MDGNELTGAVWEVLVKATDPWSAEDVAQKTGLDEHGVRRALAALREAKLLEVTRKGARFAYVALRQMDALGWARAVDLGVPLKVLDRHAKLSGALRGQGMKLAQEGRLDILENERMDQKRRQREQDRQEKLSVRVAATDMARLAGDAEAAVAAVPPTVSPRARAVHAIVCRAAQEAGRTLQALLGQSR